MFSPTFLSPELISINALINNTFSWQLEGLEPQVGYQLYIRKNSDNSLVFNSSKITSATNSHTVLANVLTNGIEYKWSISVYYSDTNYVSSDWVLFKTNTPATVTIPSLTTINQQNYLFTATYTQTESVPVKKFKFILYDTDDTVVKDSDWIYSTTVEYQVTGMLNNTDYKIECTVVNQNDMISVSTKQSFYTNYSIPDVIPELTITPLNNVGGIKLAWTNLKQVLGSVTGSYDYVTGKFNQGLHLTNGSVLTYNETIPEDFTLTFWLKLNRGFGNITWTNLSGCSVNSNDLTKLTDTKWGNAGASSTQTITSGDAFFTTTVDEINTYRVIGFNNQDLNTNMLEIDFAFYLGGNGTLSIYESGTSMGSFGSYTTGDVLKVAIESGVIKYYKNNNLLYTSLKTPIYPLVVDTSLYTISSTIKNVIVSNSNKWVDGDFLTIGDDFKIGFKENRFYYQDQYRLTCGSLTSIPENYFLVGVKPSEVIIVADEYTEIIK